MERGDGVVRELSFLEPMELSVITQGRIKGAYGLGGGKAGEIGKQILIRRNGTVQRLASLEALSVEVGDRLIVETPGGGGYGKIS